MTESAVDTPMSDVTVMGSGADQDSSRRFGPVRGVMLVVRQEFQIRLRTGRWRWLLGAWVALLVLITVLLDLSLDTGYGLEDDSRSRGVPLFGFLMLFVLGMILVISPALTAQSINGDRERGTLATLQVTRLRPTEIALGKLFASWLVGLVALALSLPFAGYAMASGGVTAARFAALYGVVALLIGVICAISQALSAVFSRSITSALLSYLVVAGLTVGTIIALTLAVPLTTETVDEIAADGSVYHYEEPHPERVWWLLAPNPFAILTDAAPTVPPRVAFRDDIYLVEDYDPLSEIGRFVRELRRPQGSPASSYRPDSSGPVWPYGLGFDVLVGVGSVIVTVRRLRAPATRLSRGVRIA